MNDQAAVDQCRRQGQAKKQGDVNLLSQIQSLPLVCRVRHNSQVTQQHGLSSNDSWASRLVFHEDCYSPHSCCLWNFNSQNRLHQSLPLFAPTFFSRDEDPLVGYAGTVVPDDPSWGLVSKADTVVFDRERGLDGRTFTKPT